MSGCLDPDPSIALELAGTALTARLNVSAQPGNALQSLPDGAFVTDKVGCAFSVVLSYAASGVATGAPILWDFVNFGGGAFGGAPAGIGGIRLPVSGVYYISTFVGVTKTTIVGASSEGLYLRRNGTSDLNNPVIVSGVTNAGSTYKTPDGAFVENMAASSPFDGALVLRSYQLSGRMKFTAGDYFQVMLIDAANPVTTVHGDLVSRIASWVTVSLLHAV